MKRFLSLFTLIMVLVIAMPSIHAQGPEGSKECKEALEALDKKYKEAMKLLDDLEDHLRKAARISSRYSNQLNKAYPRTFSAIARRAASMGWRIGLRTVGVVGTIYTIYELLLLWDKYIESLIIEDLMMEHHYSDEEARELAQELGDIRAHTNAERSNLGLGDLEYLAHLAELFDEQRSCKVGAHRIVNQLKHPTRLLDMGPIEDAYFGVPIGGWGFIPHGPVPGPIPDPPTRTSGCPAEPDHPDCIRSEEQTLNNGTTQRVCVECRDGDKRGRR